MSQRILPFAQQKSKTSVEESVLESDQTFGEDKAGRGVEREAVSAESAGLTDEKVVKPGTCDVAEALADQDDDEILFDDGELFGDDESFETTDLKEVPQDISKDQNTSTEGDTRSEAIQPRGEKVALSKPPENYQTKTPGGVRRAGEDGFVAEFYGHSRLHYLSTWSAELRRFTSLLSSQPTERGDRWASAHSGPVDGRKRSRTVIHTDMDCFFVSVALRKRPWLVGKPVAVTHSKVAPPSPTKTTDKPIERETSRPVLKTDGGLVDDNDLDENHGSSEVLPQTTKVAAAESKARGASSHADLASCNYEARARGVRNGMWLKQALQCCPELVTVPYDFAEYREVSQQLYEILSRYPPPLPPQKQKF